MSNNGHHERTAGAGDPARRRHRGPGLAGRCAPVLDEAKQLLAQARKPIDRRGPLGSLGRLGRALLKAYGGAQLVEAHTLLGAKIERLDLQRGIHQPASSLAGERERAQALAAFDAGVGGLGKHVAGIGNETAGVSLVDALAEQQQERVARACIRRAGPAPVLGLKQDLAQKSCAQEMVVGPGCTRSDGQCCLGGGNGLSQVR